MRIAVTYENGEIFQHFGHSEQFKIYETADGKVLSEEVVDPDDIEMLEDLIMAATNEALRQIDEQSQASMSKITGGLGGGLF